MKYVLYRSFGSIDKDVRKHELVAVEYGKDINEVTDALIKAAADDLAGMPEYEHFETAAMAELLKMPELTQEQLEAALIIKSILDRFDTETKVDRTTAFKAVLDHMGQTKEEGMNLNRMIDLLEKLLQAVLNEEDE